MRIRKILNLCMAIALLGLLPNLQGCKVAQVSKETSSTSQTQVQEMRRELARLHEIPRFRAMKNSFVLGLEKVSGLPQVTNVGERRTVLDVEGQGSLRHIWETHSEGNEPDAFTLEVFVDGEETPSIKGLLPDLIEAAQRCDQQLLSNPGGFYPKGSRNFYLPIPFEKSLKIDVVSFNPIGLIFMQLDYRLDDASLAGYRLEQDGEGEAMALSYNKPLPATPEFSPELESKVFEFNGPTPLVLETGGPAVIRRLAVSSTRRGARLQIRFDGEESPAVDSDLADFFGPFRGVAFNNNQCYLPMPMRSRAEIELVGISPNEEYRVEVDYEKVEAFKENWGYFHANHYQPERTVGYRPMPVLYTQGRGHWIGMSLYDTQHDHGGGDFAIVDGETSTPDFLHGINGEDYFSFAFFGNGEIFPYTEAFTNDVGRLRLHLENTYPFRESFALDWGMLQGYSPRAVAYWYEESPANNTLTLEESESLEWDVFGQVSVPTLEGGFTPDVSDRDALFAQLPSEADADAGELDMTIKHFFFGEHLGKVQGWVKQKAIGPHLNLMYVYRHHLDIGGHSHMGYYPRAMMARTMLSSKASQPVTLEISYDDPIEVMLGDEVILSDLELREGFTTASVKATLAAGENRLLARMLDTPGNNTAWAGLSLRILDADGCEISSQLQPAVENEPAE